jgi:hypothetical protein
MLDFVRKYINGIILLVICLSFNGCIKSQNINENEKYIIDITENFIDALIAQNDNKIISYINETADEYYEHINISSMVKSILDEKPKELSFLLAFILEYEINDCRIKGDIAVATVKFVNMKEQKIYLENVSGEWLVNYTKFNNDFNSNLIKSSAKLLVKLLLLPI